MTSGSANHLIVSLKSVESKKMKTVTGCGSLSLERAGAGVELFVLHDQQHRVYRVGRQVIRRDLRALSVGDRHSEINPRVLHNQLPNTTPTQSNLANLAKNLSRNIEILPRILVGT